MIHIYVSESAVKFASRMEVIHKLALTEMKVIVYKNASFCQSLYLYSKVV